MTRVRGILQQIVERVASVPNPFMLEIVFGREPTTDEHEDLIQRACDACRGPERRLDVSDLASLILKAGDPAAIVPSVLPAGDGARLSIAMVVTPGAANRQVVARIPFADQRAFGVIDREYGQLPEDGPGLLIVDVRGHGSAFQSWPVEALQCMTPTLYTRLSAVLLFSTALCATSPNYMLQTTLKLIQNPHAARPLPLWIAGAAEQSRSITAISLAGR
jgi:hypothetical protein